MIRTAHVILLSFSTVFGRHRVKLCNFNQHNNAIKQRLLFWFFFVYGYFRFRKVLDIEITMFAHKNLPYMNVWKNSDPETKKTPNSVHFLGEALFCALLKIQLVVGAIVKSCGNIDVV